ncbi:protein-L-isoaspartate O-methyltransferase family protein [Undibacterium terreum]|uniref:Protein-L-isoaspartate O-methyltransferase n=1 Tax=Undibacterium terreum TaxID=1224302 RepID=A0A916XM27_9BURK|nr:protein-L-isoaspartate O-methyltransferase [Undibacterium terreum]GGC82957.1 protein-L-isoaspartate O-methyltransferase [Undibacterium terreum]
MNIEQARFNMIEQQIRPWNVLNQDVLDMLVVVKRENFFPENQIGVVFSDTELPLSATAHSLSPKLEARIMQELAINKHEQVLLVGAGSGYLAALLGHRAAKVTAIEAEAELKALAEKNLARNGVLNVSVVQGDGLKANPSAAYDVIVVHGSLPSVPDSLLQQLKVGGRLFAVVGQPPVMSAEIVTRTEQASFKAVALFETVVQPLSQAVQPSKFTF